MIESIEDVIDSNAADVDIFVFAKIRLPDQFSFSRKSVRV